MSRNTKTKFASKGLLSLLPFLLFFTAVMLCSFYLFTVVLEESSYFGLVVGERISSTGDDDNGSTFVAGAATDRLPSIDYGKQFAQINVTWDGGGWDIKNIPVRLGNDKAILKKSAGMSFSSGFPGQGQRVIISAHVTRDFAQLEDTPNGAIVTVDTIYGPYQYRVVNKVHFSGTDRTYLEPSLKYGEQLILYTCYPRDNDGHRRTERCALICEKISGLEVTR